VDPFANDARNYDITKDVPPALFRHLLERIQVRRIDATQLELLATWLDGEPEVPDGLWYKKFPGMRVCGEGDLVKMFLLPGQAAKEPPVRG
jgi:hypothetical protein